MPLETPLRAEHEKLRATFGEYFGFRLPAHYGNWSGEYAFARQSVALVDKNYRALFSFAGADRIRYLNAMLTGNIRDLLPGQGNISLLLNPQGRILAEIDTLALEDCLLSLSHAMIRARLIETFEKFIIMDDVTLEDLTDKSGTVALEGPKSADVVRELCGIDLGSLRALNHLEATLSGIDSRLVRTMTGEVNGVEFIVHRENLAHLWSLLLKAARDLGGGPVGYEALNVLRLEEGVPWYGVDFDDNQIPHQAALESTHISYIKGCYTGQEIVERVRSRGQIQRRRVMLKFSGDSVPRPGEPLFARDSEIGFVTRAASSPKFGAVIGMGYVRREQTEPGSKIRWKAGKAEVIESSRSKNTNACVG